MAVILGEMGPDSQVLLSVAIPTIAVLVGILINNRQIERLEKQIDRTEKHLEVQIGSIRGEIGSVRGEINSVRGEISSLRMEMNARFEAAHEALLRVEGVLDARLRHLEESR